MRESAVLLALVLTFALIGAAIGNCAMDAHAGGDRRLVPLATCTSHPYLRVGEIYGCEGWTEALQPRCAGVCGEPGVFYDCAGTCEGMGDTVVHWASGALDVEVAGQWGYGRRGADGVMRFVRMQP